jgi:hypothetical protein
MVLNASQSFLTRPYPGLDSLQTVLSGVEVVIGSTRYLSGNVSLPLDQLPLRDAFVEIAIDQQGVREAAIAAGLPYSSLRVACVVYGSVIAESRLLADIALEELLSPRAVPISGAPLITESPNGVDVRVFLYLGERLSEDNLRPHIPGTWLSFSEFRISPFTALSRFSPSPLDDAVRKHFQLPAKSMTYVSVNDELLEAESLDEEVEVYVDVSILRLLQEAPSAPLSSYIQLDLVALTLSAILQKAVSLLREPDGFAHRESLVSGRSGLGALCHKIAAHGGRSVEELLTAVDQNPGLVRSLIEAYANTLSTTSLALREVS